MILPLETRAIEAGSSTIWVIIFSSIAAVLFIVLLLKIWHGKRKERLASSDSSQKSRPSFKHFFRKILPTPRYLLAKRPVEIVRPSTDVSGEHELQDGTNTRQSNMSNNRLSVRSIVTLPPYRVTPLPDEQLIAKEGERGGVDTVIEFPESDGEAEERREEEMQTLFSIREARRREAQQRAAARTERREAVRQGNFRRVAELDAQTRTRSRAGSNATDPERSNSRTGLQTNASDQTDSALLIAQLQSLREHNASTRRVSSVSYADLGVARHDGSRIRGESFDSDRPLLDSAASIGDRNHSRASSIASTRTPSRSRAVLTVDPNRRPSTPGSYTSQEDGGFLTPQSTGGDLPPEPPSYDDHVGVHGGELPPYSSPVQTRRPEFPVFDSRGRAPSIVVHSSSMDGASLVTQGLPVLQLNTGVSPVPPVIQVVQATPVTPFPPSPVSGQ